MFKQKAVYTEKQSFFLSSWDDLNEISHYRIICLNTRYPVFVELFEKIRRYGPVGEDMTLEDRCDVLKSHTISK